MQICSQSEYKPDLLRNTLDKLEKNVMQKNKHFLFPQCTYISVHMPAPFTLTT